MSYVHMQEWSECFRNRTFSHICWCFHPIWIFCFVQPCPQLWLYAVPNAAEGTYSCLSHTEPVFCVLPDNYWRKFSHIKVAEDFCSFLYPTSLTSVSNHSMLIHSLQIFHTDTVWWGLGDIFMEQMKCTHRNVFVKSDARVWGSGGLWGDTEVQWSHKLLLSKTPNCFYWNGFNNNSKNWIFNLIFENNFIFFLKN